MDFYNLDFRAGFDCGGTRTVLPFRDFRAVFFFILDFRVDFDCGGTRTILPFTDFHGVKSRIIIWGTSAVLQFTDFSTPLYKLYFLECKTTVKPKKNGWSEDREDKDKDESIIYNHRCLFHVSTKL